VKTEKLFRHLGIGSVYSIECNCCSTLNSMVVVVKATEQCGKQSPGQQSLFTGAI